MKSSKIILFITLLIFTKSQDTLRQNYSIDTFIDYLQKSGIWEVLFQVKIYFGTTIAIEVCKEYVKSPHCEEVIQVYMVNSESEPEPDNRANSRRAFFYYDRSELMPFLEKHHYLEILTKTIPLSKAQRIKFKLISKEY